MTANPFLHKRTWAYALFWSWNLIFLAFMLLGFAPTILPEMITAVRAGTIPYPYVITASIIAAIPAFAVLIGLTALRQQPGKLLLLGYGVEGPLMLILAFRTFIVRDATAVVNILLAIGAVGALTLLWHLLDSRLDERGPLLKSSRLIGLTLLLGLGLYASLWLAFYALPASSFIAEAVQAFFRNFASFWRDLVNTWRDNVAMLPFLLIGGPLFLYSATLFVVMPLAVPLIYFQTWRHSVQALTPRYGRFRPLAGATAVLVAAIIIIGQASRQPQQAAFALLETPPATVAEAEALLAQEETIRAGLVNAYLAPQRYLSAAGEMNHVSEMYEYSLDFSPAQAARVQSWYETVAAPLLYQPVHTYNSPNRWDNRTLREEPQAAAQLYEQFFDEDILTGEREAIAQAARATWEPDQARANWQAVDEREVFLAQQEVTITEHDDWAEVTLFEAYENQTAQRQEVIYYFSLPESAVLTGVWLGNSPNRDERFAFRVAPRGAAQAVYQNEVRRRVDPALLEQIGPRQYRLRIFPIPPQSWRWDGEQNGSTLLAGEPLYLWLTYQTMGTADGWPLPQLAEHFNVYWDDQSERRINGEPVAADETEWLPETAAAAQPFSQLGHRVDFPNGQSVVAVPAPAESAAQPNGRLKLAVILDRSRSMSRYADVVALALEDVAAWGTAVDVYLTASSFRGEAPSVTSLAELNPDDIVYYGGQNAAELLLQYEALHTNQPYDAILVLTDSTGYELSSDALAPSTPDAPVWMIHLGRYYPLGYDDATLEALQASGGGIANSVDEALARFMEWQTNSSTGTADWLDGYRWLVLPTETAAAMSLALTQHTPTDPFAAFAARRLILAQMQAQRGQLSDLAVLDSLHALATEHGIVTPYSSMIVLVESRQERLLDEMERQGDRFEREMEDVGETENAPLTVTGVPEPEEWLLLALAVGALIWLVRKRQAPAFSRQLL